MRNTIRGMVLVLLAVACSFGAWSARAVGPEVRDNAGLFSPAAVKQADETIRGIQKNFRKDLLVETFASVPENRKEEYTRSREEFFANFVRERAQAARLDGIYVMIMKESPPHRFRIQVGVGEVTRQRAFVPANRDELVRLLQASFREDKFDDGLRNAVGFVERTLRSNLQVSSSTVLPPAVKGNSPPPSAPFVSPARPSGISPLFVVVVMVGAILVVMFLARLLRGGMGNSGGGLRGAGGLRGGGGGGLFSGLLGGLGGALAGNWLYDQFSSRHTPSNDVHAANSPDSSHSDVGGDYSSSGGDVGGGDFGGGDFGGGGDA